MDTEDNSEFQYDGLCTWKMLCWMITSVTVSSMYAFYWANSRLGNADIFYFHSYKHSNLQELNTTSVSNYSIFIPTSNTTSTSELINKKESPTAFLKLSLYQKIIYQMTDQTNQTWNRISINTNKVDYCLDLGTGLGNVLASYWVARAAAFLSNSSFEFMQHCKKQGRSAKFFLNEGANMFCHYLPLNSSKTMYEIYNFSDDEFKLLQTWNEHTITHYLAGYIYREPTQLLFYNPVFWPIMKSESYAALKQYFSKHSDLKFPISEQNNEHNIVIHFRCGDILGIKNADYGLLTLSFYQNAFKLLNATKESKIYFLTQTGEKSLRKWTSTREHTYKQKCIDLLDRYIPHIKGLYDFDNFTVFGNNDINQDFYSMAFAKNLIISMSSFAQQAGMINENNVIFPNWGPWKDMAKEWINGSLWTPESHHYINVKEPDKMYIDSTEYHGWSIEKIADHLIKH